MRNSFLVIVFLLAGCEAYDAYKYEQAIVEKMGWLEQADPDKDLENAIQRKDFRFKGINGYSVHTPGVDINFLDIENIDPIEGKSDVIEGKEHLRLVKLAGKYAKEYNNKMLAYQKKNFGWHCKGKEASNEKASI